MNKTSNILTIIGFFIQIISLIVAFTMENNNFVIVFLLVILIAYTIIITCKYNEREKLFNNSPSGVKKYILHSKKRKKLNNICFDKVKINYEFSGTHQANNMIALKVTYRLTGIANATIDHLKILTIAKGRGLIVDYEATAKDYIGGKYVTLNCEEVDGVNYYRIPFLCRKNKGDKIDITFEFIIKNFYLTYSSSILIIDPFNYAKRVNNLEIHVKNNSNIKIYSFFAYKLNKRSLKKVYLSEKILNSKENAKLNLSRKEINAKNLILISPNLIRQKFK